MSLARRALTWAARSTPAWLLMALPGAARADVVHLLNGQTVEGRVVETPQGVRVEVAFGRLTIDRREVLRIERKPLDADVYEERLRTLDRRDPQAARALARWCEQHRLADEAAALYEQARQAELTIRVEATDPTDPEALLGLHTWAREQRYPEATLREVLGMVTAVAPDHDEARALLGQERFRGEWRPRAEVEAVLREEEARAMRAQGLILYGGEWLRPEEARLRQAEAELAAAREALAREAAALARERADLARQREELGAGLAALEDARREIEALREELANERLALADAMARNRYAASIPFVVTRRRPTQPCPPAAPQPQARPTTTRPQPAAPSGGGGVRIRIGR